MSLETLLISFVSEYPKESFQMLISAQVEIHENEMEEFLAVVDWKDAQRLLHENGSVLLHEHSQSYALLSCLEDEMNGFHDKMKRTARNSQILSHITELASSMNRHPRDVVLPFFARVNSSAFQSGFDDAVNQFVTRIAKRAVEKRKEMAADEPPTEKFVGPGGLDPVEVFDSLPAELQEAFEKKDMHMLQVALEAMPIADAKHYMEQCEASGLWIPSKNDDEPSEPMEPELVA